MTDTVTVRYGELVTVVAAVLREAGMEPDRATVCAALFVDADRDGVRSHGLARVPRFLRILQRGVVNVHGAAVRVSGSGALERWNGHFGPGNLNAQTCMARAITLAREHGIGCVALAHSSHLMRAGAVGWQAAEAGCIGLCWSNTMANMPTDDGRARGRGDLRLGNNPLVIAIPRPPAHVVLDMALSQFSYGTLARYREAGEPLPVVGGWTAGGEPTTDPREVARMLPIGHWKGAGLALVLDMMAAALSGGRATYEIKADPEQETGHSQVFLALQAGRAQVVADILAFTDTHYPGAGVWQHRQTSLRDGVPVDRAVWIDLCARRRLA